MGREMAGSRMLVVGVYRPEEVALGRGGERHPLEPVVNELRREQGEVTVDLGQAEGREFVEALLDSEANRLGAGFRETLYRQTRGHPLFTVELLRGMEERGDLVRDGEGRWVEGEALDWERLPARVEAVIAERVGRLVGGLRETLAVASVEGEEFTAEVVARAGGVDEEQVVQRLSGELDRKHRLVSTQGIMRAGGQRLSRYRFRHILFQRYAYGSLDRVRRSHLHEAVGTALEGLYGDKVDEVAVELARHFQEGGNVGKAISYLGRAGQQAVRVSANEEAIAHLTQALALLGTLPETLERDGQELMLQVGLIAALQSTRGYEDAGVGRACARARELCGRVGELPQRFLVLWLLALYHASRSELGIARGLAEELHSLAGQVEGVVLSAMAEFALEWISLLRGQYDSARAHMERATALYDAELHRPVRSLYGTDPGLASLVYGCFVLWLMGYPEQALQQSRTALALAKELDDPFNIALAQGALSRLHVARRDVGTVHDLSRACVRLAIQRGFPYWIAVGIFCQGWALAEKGQVEEGIALMRQSMAGYRATGAECGYPHQLTDLAGVYGRVGRAEEGLALVDEALEMARSNDERWYEPETHRTKGELLLLRGTDEAQAEDCFQRAIELAGQQSARMWKLRATVSLCRLWQRQGKRRKALKQLAQIYDGFSEGFDTPDLQEAQALLEEMG
jgi:predicted ATPase